MSRTLDDVDRRLLNVLQEQMPLVDRPFEKIAAAVGIDEAETLRRIEALKAKPGAVIRQISAIFDTKALGYQSSLVAARIESDRLEAAVERINAHPGVTHNYLRNHAFNLWYTLAVPPDSRLGLEGTLDVLHRESGAAATRMFPTLKLYKIGVSFDLGGESSGDAPARPAFSEQDREKSAGLAITDQDRRMIRVLQQDLPIVSRPFDGWAEQAGVSVGELLHATGAYLEQRRMRRFSAVLHHRAAGFSANGMGVWVVPTERQDEFGRLAATFPAVSHCYLRPSYPDWPYSLFTMVHAKSEEGCMEVLAAISEKTGILEYGALFSSREFKKVRLRYFTGEIEAWERQHGL